MGKAIYTAKCEKAWDGDDAGNEWTCGVAVYRAESAGDAYGQTRTIYRVFEDDGEGNGNHLCSFTSLFDARRYADLYVRHMDEGGYGGTPTHIEMCRLSEARGLDVPSTRQWSASNPG